MVFLIKINSNCLVMGLFSWVDVIFNVKYLFNGIYLWVLIVKLFFDDNSVESVINIFEFGEWDISDNYFLVMLVEFKDILLN